MKKILALVCFLIFVTLAQAWDVPEKARVANRSPGYCCWASLETLGYVHKIKPLYNLVENRSKDPDVWMWTPYGWELVPKNVGDEQTMQAKLDELSVRHKIQKEGDFSQHLLKKYANTEGCVVGFRTGAFGKYGHAVVLTHFDDKRIEFYDPNHTDCMYEATREWLDYWWSGLVVVVLKD